MAKQLVIYSLDQNGTVPEYIENGGYFPLSGSLVGLTINNATLPEGVNTISKAQLLSRLLSMGLLDIDDNVMSNAEVEESMNGFLTQIDLQDLS